MRLSLKAKLVLMPASKQIVSPSRSGCCQDQLTLEEESRLVGNQVAGKILRSVHQAGDDCSS